MYDFDNDRNKTELTKTVTRGVMAWLREIGAKCIEHEVSLAPRWVADVAAFWTPTFTEAGYQHLFPLARRVSPKLQRDPEVQAAMRVQAEQQHRIFDALPNPITIAVEVKTDRQDFRSDRKWKRDERVADLQILAFVPGVVHDDENPSSWWRVLFTGVADRRVEVFRCPLVPVSIEQRLRVVQACAERRWNRESNGHLYQLAKAQRRAQNDLSTGCPQV